MKKFSIILNVVLVLVTLFFGVFAMLKTDEANKLSSLSEKMAEDAVTLQNHALKEAANAREAEAAAKEAEARALEAMIQLEICQNSK